MTYVSLHTHSEHSELDSTAKIKELFHAAAQMGQPALAITDHGTLGGMWKAQAAADQNGVKLIPGIEAYLAFGSRFERNTLEVDSEDELDVEDQEKPEQSDGDEKPDGKKTVKRYQHLTLLATSPAGWRNLVKIANASWDTVWGKYPRIDYELIGEHHEDILILTGCLGGPILGPLARGDYAGAEENLLRMIELVGRENVYVEVMEHGIERESVILPLAAELAQKHQVTLVATNDSHHVHADDAVAHDAWLAVRTKAKLDDTKRYRFQGTGYHHRSETEMLALREEPWWATAVTNTAVLAERVADRCLPLPTPKLPKFPTPAGFTSNRSYFQHIVREGATRRYGPLEQRQDVRDRLNQEVSVILHPNRDIVQLYPDGFIDYFLITHELVSWARANGILVGPGRGSAAGSIVAYCLGITDLCPLENGLLFERFMEAGRPDFPDIDIDFEALRRSDLLDHLEDMWGKKSVSLIGSFASSKTKRAIKDAARVLDATRVGEQLAKLVPVEFGNPFSFKQLFDTDNAQSAEFRAQYEKSGEVARSVVELASKFADTVAGSGIHACGVIVSDLDLTELIPQRVDRKTGRRISAWDSKDVEKFGLLKMDVLSLRNLDVAKKAIDFIADTTGERIDFDAIPHPNTEGDDRVDAAWRAIRDGRTAGVFQMESPKMTELGRQVGPENLTDLSAVVALFRPGPLSAGMDQLFAQRKNGAAVDYTQFTTDPEETRILDSVMGETYGTFVFQEQIMRLSGLICGFDAIERGRLRRAVGKKDLEEMTAVGEIFRERAVVDNFAPDGTLLAPAFSQQATGRLWEAIKGSGSYLFNASHSAAYAKLAYVTAYLKANWPSAYGAAILAVTDKDDKRIEALKALQAEGVRILAPDVNRSRPHSFPEDATTVRLGLSEIKGVGVSGDRIVEVREASGLAFTSLSDVIERARQSGAATPGSADMKRLATNHIDGLIEAGAMDEFGPRMGQFITSRGLRADRTLQVPDVEWGYLERSARQRARLHVSLGEHPLVRLQQTMRDWSKPGPVNAVTGKPFHSPAIPVSHVPDEDGSPVTVIGLLAKWGERTYRGGRLANITLEGSRSAIDGVLWDNTLQDARAADLIPPVGSLLAVSGRVTIREFESEDEEGQVTVSTQKELTVSQLYPVPVDDPPSGTLPECPFPTITFPLVGTAPEPEPEPAQPTLFDEPAPAEPAELAAATETPIEPTTAAGVPRYECEPQRASDVADLHPDLPPLVRQMLRLRNTRPKWVGMAAAPGMVFEVLDPSRQEVIAAFEVL